MLSDPLPEAVPPPTRRAPRGDGVLLEGKAHRCRLPWTVTEEFFVESELLGDPATMHFEVRIGGTFDESRLAAALRSACALHPLSRLRLAANRFLLRPGYWEFTEDGPAVAVQTADVADEAAMDALRGRFCSVPLDLKAGPPFRVLLVRRPGGDSLLFSIHHALSDGIGGVRFVNSVARAYAGLADPVPDVDPVVVRDVRSFLGRGKNPDRPDATWRAHLRKYAPVLGRPGESATGYGVCTRVLPAEECRRLDPRPYGDDVTLNDLLIAALHRAVAGWNAALGDATDGVAVLVPVNVRPAAWNSDVVANLALVERNRTTAAERADPLALLAVVSDQTKAIKASAGFSTLLSRPDWLYALITRVYLPLTFQLCRLRPPGLDERSRRKGQWASILCANLGRINRKVAGFGGAAGELTEFWSSPPAWMPLGLGMTTAILHGRLHVGLRYHRRLFDDNAAREFLSLFLEQLVALGNPVGARGTESAAPA